MARVDFMRLLLWPVEFILKLVGKLVAAVLGLALSIVGVVLCFTIIGAIIGIPLTIFGVLLMIKGIF
jgi:hypothetical protein